MHFLEILVEEPSMKAFLEVLLPRLLPSGYQLGANVFIRPHQGKQDLMKSIPRKARAYAYYYGSKLRLLILHDQDSNDCRPLKAKILEQIPGDVPYPVLVRIPCRELENWYLGDLTAIEQAYPPFQASAYQQKRKYRSDRVGQLNGYDELKKLVPQFQKIDGARRIAPWMHVTVGHNRSRSFGHFLTGLSRLLR
jgi:hypothetical protein